MNTITHGIFTDTFKKQMQLNYAANQAQEILILGAVFLFWKHNKNIAYLNSAMQYARGRKGIRVNAVRAFLINFTGAVFKQGKDFTKAGRKMSECPEGFAMLSSWLEWADANAQEPEYNLAKHQLKIVNMLQHEKKLAEDNGQDAMVKVMEETIVSYALSQEQHKAVVVAA